MSRRPRLCSAQHGASRFHLCALQTTGVTVAPQARLCGFALIKASGRKRILRTFNIIASGIHR